MAAPRHDDQDTTPNRAVLTLDYFLQAGLDEARIVLQTAQAVVRDREAAGRTEPPGPGSATEEQDEPAPGAEKGEASRPPARTASEDPPAPAAAPATTENPAQQVQTRPATGKPETPAQKKPAKLKNARAEKLTAAQVREIRRTYRPNKNTKALAKKYSVTENTIRSVANRTTWDDLAPQPGEYQPPDRPAKKQDETPPTTPSRSNRNTVEATAEGRGNDANGSRKAPPTAGSPPVRTKSIRKAEEAQEIARLSPDSITNIRERLADKVPLKRIARDFGVSTNAIASLGHQNA